MLSGHLSRPPYVLLHPGDQSGCGFHRMYRPIEIMARMGVAAGRAEIQFPNDDMISGMKPDIVVWQRQNDEAQLEHVRRYRRLLPEAFFVYEIDDILWAVPEASPHKQFMDPEVDKKTAAAIALCDAVTVTTDDLAKHIRLICGEQVDVRVVPNMLGADDLEMTTGVREKVKVPRQSGKLRVGWGGGIGHPGDLALLSEAFVALKDEVQWVFLGMKPEMPEGVECEFHMGTAPNVYLQALASLDLDLMVAPLEDNIFNQCKSNLRLLEGGACKYPVIASPIAPYKTANPPVFGYADSPQAWIDLIRKFGTLDETERQVEASAMRQWVERHFVMNADAIRRLSGWLPRGVRPFAPVVRKAARTGRPVIVAPKAGDVFRENYTVVNTLAEAIDHHESDVLYVRPDVIMNVEQVARLAGILDDRVGTISIMSNDAGPNAFPNASVFTAMDPSLATKIDGILAKRLEDPDSPMADMPVSADIPICCGPAILIRRAALNAVGRPPLEDYESIDMALAEWSAGAAASGYKNALFFGAYIPVATPAPISMEQGKKAALRVATRWPQGRIDAERIIEFRAALEMVLHREAYSNIPPANRSDYAAWAQVMDEAGPREMEAASQYYQHPQCKIVPWDQALTLIDEGVENMDLGWVMFIQPGVQVNPLAHYWIEAAIEANPLALAIYGDHDFITEGKRNNHDFKPNLDLHMLMGRDYVSPAMAIRLSAAMLEDIVDKSPDGNLDIGLYYAALRAIALNGRSSVVHVPRIFLHLQSVVQRDHEKVMQEKISIAKTFAATIGLNIDIIQHPGIPGLAEVSYKMRPEFESEPPLVSIIIPTKNRLDMLAPCLQTLIKNTTYPNYEVIVVSNNTDAPTTLTYLDNLRTGVDPRIRVVTWNHPYNWSALNNWATLEEARGSILCYLNDDTRVLSPHWLDEMVAAALDDRVGAVGARLLYPHGYVQHIGVVVDKALTGHIHKGMPVQYPGYMGFATISHESTAVTGACLVVGRDKFLEVGGFDESFANNFNDVIFCVQLYRKGYHNVLAARAELQHYEGVTRSTVATQEGGKILLDDAIRLREVLTDSDPYWNPNFVILSLDNGMSVSGMHFDALDWTRRKEPWSEQNPGVVLLMGPSESALAERRDGSPIYELAAAGLIAQIVNPPMQNIKPFDMRDPVSAARSLRRMGVSQIVVSSLGDAHSSVLHFLTRLGLPIRYRPIDAESVCARRNLRPNGSKCDTGWRTPEVCQGCIDQNGSPHGFVQIDGWRSDFESFFARPQVTIDPGLIPDPEFSQAIYEVYGGGRDDSHTV